MKSANYYCPRNECSWEGAAMPPGQACPRCGHAVESYNRPTALDNVAPDGNPRDRPASQNVVLDQEMWSRSHVKHELTKMYETFVLELAKLVAEKQIAYGDSFRHTRKVLAVLYPNGITVEQYGDLLTITRIIDKLFRVANQKGYGGESPYKDIAGYAIRAACEDERGVASTPDNIGPAVEL